MRFKTDERLYTVIGKNIKKYRINAGLTQVQLCDKTGISLSCLTKLESAKCDKSISLSFLNLLANTLNVDIIEFFTEYELNTCDVNKDGAIDAADASNVLSYYSHVSTGGKLNFEEFMNNN